MSELLFTARPWDNHPKMHGGKDSCPFELRHWTFNPNSGYVVSVDEACVFDTEAKRWQVKTNRDSLPEGAPLLDHDQVDKIFTYAERHRCKVAKAVLSVVNIKRLSEEYIEACKAAPDVYVRGRGPAEKEPAAAAV